MRDGCLVCCGGVFWVGGGLELGSGAPISKLALGLVLGLRALMGPILKLKRPTPIRWPRCKSWTRGPPDQSPCEKGVWRIGGQGCATMRSAHFAFRDCLREDHNMSSVLFLGEERDLGFGWTHPGKGCGLPVVGLRSVYQDVHVGQLAGGGACCRNACETGLLATRCSRFADFFACAHLHRTVRRKGLRGWEIFVRSFVRGEETSHSRWGGSEWLGLCRIRYGHLALANFLISLSNNGMGSCSYYSIFGFGRDC